MPSLTDPKREEFAQQLAKGISATRAHAIAGFSGDSGNASRLQGQASVQQRVAEIVAQRHDIEDKAIELAAYRLSLSKEVILRELMRVGLAKIDDVCEFNEAGALVKESDKITPDALAAIAEIRHGADGSVRVRMHDKLGALEKLGRHLGLFKHEVVLSGNIEHDVRDIGSAPALLLDRVTRLLDARAANENAAEPAAGSSERDPVELGRLG